MTDSNRPPAFRIKPSKPEPMRLFYCSAHGDYVIARTASDASCFWMDHFDDRCSAQDFERIPDDEAIEIFIDPDSCKVVEAAEVACLKQLNTLGKPQSLPARIWASHYGPGYLASTEE